MQIDADPDPAYNSDADPDPAYHFEADPDPTFQFFHAGSEFFPSRIPDLHQRIEVF
jgi:hypothetical protein